MQFTEQRDWLLRHASDRLIELLSLRPELTGVRLTRQRGGPRHRPGLLLGDSAAGRLVIGVETLADEWLDVPHPLVARLVHQLQAALAETLADALRRHAAHAVLLIHVRCTRGDDLRRETASGLATELFLQELAPSGMELARSRSADAWITEPFLVREQAGPEPHALAGFVAKLVSRG